MLHFVKVALYYHLFGNTIRESIIFLTMQFVSINAKTPIETYDSL